MLSVETTDKFVQFRNESEVRAESKGTYIKGTVTLPAMRPNDVFHLELSLVADRDYTPDFVHNLHPNLLFLTGRCIIRYLIQWQSVRPFPASSGEGEVWRQALRSSDRVSDKESQVTGRHRTMCWTVEAG